MCDEVLLSQISMPGTHNTMTYPGYGGDFAMCQSMSLADQLMSGIRVLDIRCRHLANTFFMYHGEVYQRKNFMDVLRDVAEFLDKYPSEAILMRVAEESRPSGNTRTFEATFKEYLSTTPYSR